MATDTLGIYATSNGQDVMKGANEFIAQVSRMDKESLKALNNISQHLVVVDGKIKGVATSYDHIAKFIKSNIIALGGAFSAQQFARKIMEVRGEIGRAHV